MFARMKSRSLKSISLYNLASAANNLNGFNLANTLDIIDEYYKKEWGLKQIRVAHY
jgi:hypothetical protein